MREPQEGGWPQLPPPDLSEGYAGLPRGWKVGAVLLADRILAAAYREDVCEVASRVQRDVEQGAVRGMTLEEYIDEATEGHQRVVDINKALQCLQYSPAAQAPLSSLAAETDTGGVVEVAWRCFRGDVEAELERRGVELE
jgi:hypothetical protein